MATVSDCNTLNFSKVVRKLLVQFTHSTPVDQALWSTECPWKEQRPCSVSECFLRVACYQCNRAAANTKSRLYWHKNEQRNHQTRRIAGRSVS
ncbi:hypothetical protein PBY51_010478 [Eleginops maclovinus]|uniref:Uncharacterized protein n=1 Tax=Eleginops maclovinus TaxID=56733 RepID=A0AAN7XAL8_ELEMC|nr:hypothetical protein PBY51_010478 [Eleginops maclovinus]